MVKTEKHLVSLLQNDSTLQSLLGGTTGDKRIYPVIPNRDEAFPCIVYDVEDAPVNILPGETLELEFSVRCFHRESKSSAMGIVTRLMEILNGYQYLSSEYKIYSSRRVSGPSNLSEDDRQMFSFTMTYLMNVREDV